MKNEAVKRIAHMVAGAMKGDPENRDAAVTQVVRRLEEDPALWIELGRSGGFHYFVSRALSDYRRLNGLAVAADPGGQPKPGNHIRAAPLDAAPVKPDLPDNWGTNSRQVYDPMTYLVAFDDGAYKSLGDCTREDLERKASEYHQRARVNQERGGQLLNIAARLCGTVRESWCRLTDEERRCLERVAGRRKVA